FRINGDLANRLRFWGFLANSNRFGVRFFISFRIRMRRPLEKLRHPSATELLLSNDGDHILEGCLTNFFVLSLKDNMEEDGESAENMQKNKYEDGERAKNMQTAHISGGVLPGVVREVVIEEVMYV
nr:D-aminoacid aminotransferase-like PLP-dependent enzymes superfamily protein [Tanacetum cinerariifolium]